MENATIPTKSRIHPLVATAAVSVILASLLGVAAVTGMLPNSHGTVAPVAGAPVAIQASGAVAPQGAAVPIVHHRPHPAYAAQQPSASNYDQNQRYQQAPAYQQAPTYVQAPASTQPAQASQNSPVGIGVGALVGGLVGHQVGGGNGKTLATVAGALAGGYAGNEVAKHVGN